MRWANLVSDMLEKTDWGEQFDPSDILTIARYMVITSYHDRDFIFMEGDTNSYMAFISHGKVDIIKGANTDSVVATLPTGTHLGEQTLVDEMPRSASARANGDTTLLVLGKDDFEQIMTDHPPLGIKMLKNIARVISSRLRETTDQLYVRASG